jgi:hypothetical protein
MFQPSHAPVVCAGRGQQSSLPRCRRSARAANRSYRSARAWVNGFAGGVLTMIGLIGIDRGNN